MTNIIYQNRKGKNLIEKIVALAMIVSVLLQINVATPLLAYAQSVGNAEVTTPVLSQGHVRMSSDSETLGLFLGALNTKDDAFVLAQKPAHVASPIAANETNGGLVATLTFAETAYATTDSSHDEDHDEDSDSNHNSGCTNNSNSSTSVNTNTTTINGVTVTTTTTEHHEDTNTNCPPTSTYTIVSSAGNGGSISPAGIVTVTSGSDSAYTITPDSGFVIEDVLVDGVSVGTVNLYTFTNVSANHTISVTFKCVPHVNTKPVITVTGTNPVTLTVGGSYTDQGATALDLEDGNITSSIVTTGTVNTAVVGTYTITYNVQDSQGLAADTKTRTVNVVLAPPTPKVTLSATKIVCDSETKLPNWGTGGPDITATTATDYVAAHPGCVLTPDWEFQWGYGAKSGNTGVADLPRDLVGEADGSLGAGTQTGSGYNDWKTFGPTNGSGVATVEIGDLAGASRIWVREVLKAGYIPFTEDAAHPTGSNVSAETYCHTDVLKYDNYDYVNAPALGHTYYCVSFNAAKDVPVNSYTITSSAGLGGTISPLGITTVTSGANSSFTITPDSGYAVADVLVDGVSVGALSLYTFTNVTANHTISATFTLIPPPNTKPVITVVGGNPLTITVGTTTYVDPGATALDLEDGDITSSIVATGTVNGAVVGTYTITYNVQDSQGLAADTKTRTVHVVAGPVVNTKPVITVTGANPYNIAVGSTYTDLGATAADLEDGDITSSIVATGTVNTAVIGTYTITYDVVDSKGLAADTKTRTVNVVALPPVNTKPVITVTGSTTVSVDEGTTYTDLGATALDLEDGDITSSIVATGTVNTAVVGTYTISYNVSDSKGLAADTKTRTVNVVAVTPVNTKPVITVTGTNPVTLTVGGSYTDQGATALDLEDGNITSSIVTTGTVNTAVVGTYTITYNVQDSQGLAADTKTRTVNVQSGGGGGGSGTFDYYGCTDKNATNFNPLANKNDGSCSYPGGGSSNQRPVITLTGSSSVSVVEGSTYTDQGATANDPEDGNITNKIVVTGIPTTNTPGAFTVTYNATDSQALAALPVTRTVSVTPKPEVAGACTFLTEYMRLGANNNPSEVIKLQTFLRTFEGFKNVEVTGFFDLTTDSAVRIFQNRYKTDVLDPWKLPKDTGYVYYSTQKKINEIFCQREFPYTSAQAAEIAQYRALFGVTTVAVSGGTVAANPRPQGTNTAVSSVLAGTVVTGAQGKVAGANTVKTVASVKGEGSGDGVSSYLEDILRAANKGSDVSIESSEKEDETGMTEEVGGTTTENEAGMLASVAKSTGLESRAILPLFFILLGTVMLVWLWYRQYNQPQEAPAKKDSIF